MLMIGEPKDWAEWPHGLKDLTEEGITGLYRVPSVDVPGRSIFMCTSKSLQFG
jgi:hypothetical protein